MSVHKKSRKKFIAAVAVLIILAGALWLIPKNGKQTYETAAADTGDIVVYNSFTGNVEAKNRQTVTADRVMQVSRVYIKEGDAVKQGDNLAATSMGEVIKSKINGEVTNLSVSEGDQVMSGTRLMDIIDYNKLQVKVKVDEYDLSAVATGSQVTINIGALNKNIQGTISSVPKEGQETGGVTYFNAAADIAGDNSIRVGMTAEVRIISGKAIGAVTLPMTAVQFDAENNPYVFKKNSKGKPVKTAISTGINDGLKVEVKTGISKGDTVMYPKTAAADTTSRGLFRRPSNTGNTGGGNNGGNT